MFLKARGENSNLIKHSSVRCCSLFRIQSNTFYSKHPVPEELKLKSFSQSIGKKTHFHLWALESLAVRIPISSVEHKSFQKHLIQCQEILNLKKIKLNMAP